MRKLISQWDSNQHRLFGEFSGEGGLSPGGRRQRNSDLGEVFSKPWFEREERKDGTVYADGIEAG
jgi:hypothetical protein